MTETDHLRQDPAPFRALLTPHRSLSSRGFLIVMAAISAVSFCAGMAFLLMGAWPVFGFFGLDVVLIYLAFCANYRAAREYETVEITRDALVLTQVDQAGRARAETFDPFWVRVELDEWVDGRTFLKFVQQHRHCSFGRFLLDEERHELADALKGALVAARGGARI